jgi:hypothetical protein
VSVLEAIETGVEQTQMVTTPFRAPGSEALLSMTRLFHDWRSRPRAIMQHARWSIRGRPVVDL